MYKIIIFGTGGVASFLSRKIKADTKIVAYLNTITKEKNIGEIPVVGLDDLEKIDYDYIVIGFYNVEKGFEVLKKGGIPKEKIVGYSYNEPSPYVENNCFNKYNILVSNYLQDKMIPELFEIDKVKFYPCAMDILEVPGVIERDYVREQSLVLIANEIRRKNVAGSMAEVGVFRGDFAKKISFLFPERKIYLFDTFEGFDKRDICNDKTLKWGENTKSFSDTSVELVLEKMRNREDVIVKKGYFPQTFDLENEKFSFVSLDADLYDPIKAGLEIFWPLLSEGGYIMVHDYNNLFYKGATEAVQEFCDSMKISYVPLPDIAGSIVITK